MKKAMILSAVLAFTFAACNNSTGTGEQKKSDSTAQSFNLDTAKFKSGDLFYQCEMHHEVLSAKPDNCPKCGMALSELKKI